MKKPVITPEELLDILANSATEEWQKAISSRLESVRALMLQEAWEKGIDRYLRCVYARTITKIMEEKTPVEGVHYLRGFCAALSLVICLPRSVDQQIEQEANKDKKPGPQKDTWA